jgi:hypothetical protein
VEVETMRPGALDDFTDEELKAELAARKRARKPPKREGYSGWLSPALPRIIAAYESGKNPRNIAEELIADGTVQHLRKARYRQANCGIESVTGQITQILTKLGLRESRRPEMIAAAAERRQKAMQLRDSGLTYREIGGALGGITSNRARDIVMRARAEARQNQGAVAGA